MGSKTLQEHITEVAPAAGALSATPLLELGKVPAGFPGNQGEGLCGADPHLSQAPAEQRGPALPDGKGKPARRPGETH